MDSREHITEEDAPTGDALIAHFKVCDCHDSWDQCPCADAGHPDDGGCDCCPFGIGLCGPKPPPVEESRAELYQRGYDDGVEQEQARIAKELGRLHERERLAWADGYVRAYHLTRDIPPTAPGDRGVEKDAGVLVRWTTTETHCAHTWEEGSDVCMVCGETLRLDDEDWSACWDAIANAAWPDAGATRSEVLEMLLSVRPEPSVTPPAEPGDPS